MDLNRALLSVALLAASAVAQRTWTVDMQNRPGTDFTDLPAAFAAVAHGDTVVVRDGFYTSGRVDKGIRLVGLGLLGAQPGLLVENLPPGTVFTMRGFSIGNPSQPLVLTLRNNRGAVHLAQLRTPDPGPTFPGVYPALTIEDCALVTLDDVTTWGAPALVVRRSRLVAVRTSITELNVSSWFDASDVTLVHPRFQSLGGAPTAQPAIAANNGRLVLTGDGASFVQGGYVGMLIAAPAVFATGGTLVVDPALPLNPFRLGPTVRGTATLVVRDLVSAGARDVAAGRTATFELCGRPGTSGVLVLGLPVAPAVTPWGELWLDPATHVLVGSGRLDAARRLSFAVPLPAGLPRGAPFTLQGLADVGFGIELTPPAVAVLD